MESIVDYLIFLDKALFARPPLVGRQGQILAVILWDAVDATNGFISERIAFVIGLVRYC